MSKSNDIVLNEQLVSRKHAELRKEGMNYYIVDLESANGTILNDSPILRRNGFLLGHILLLRMRGFEVDMVFSYSCFFCKSGCNIHLSVWVNFK